MEISKQILNRIKECIHKNELEFNDQVELFKYLGNDILQVQTKQGYGKKNNKSSMAYKFAKGKRADVAGVWLITDCD